MNSVLKRLLNVANGCTSIYVRASSNMATEWKNAGSIYEFAEKDIDGNPISMDKYKGFVTVIVNVACKCGFTEKQYPQLQAMYEKFQQEGLRVVAFPSNQFMSQEPWPEAEIKQWVTDKFHVTFDLMSKINVNGDNADPLWNYLKHKQGGTMGDFIKWNFSKFLIDRHGQPVKRYGPNVEPNEMIKDVIELLKK